jgi:protein-S-isoprenylcysteine O-methyltransferase Ste14
MSFLRKILPRVFVLLGFLLLYMAMTGRPGRSNISSLAYVGLWVGAAAAMIVAYWLSRRLSKEGA